MEKLSFPVLGYCPALGGPEESEEYWVAEVPSGTVWEKSCVDMGEKERNW